MVSPLDGMGSDAELPVGGSGVMPNSSRNLFSHALTSMSASGPSAVPTFSSSETATRILAISVSTALSQCNNMSRLVDAMPFVQDGSFDMGSEIDANSLATNLLISCQEGLPETAFRAAAATSAGIPTAAAE